VREHHESRPWWRLWDWRWAGWWAESDALPGWTVAARTENDLRHVVFESLRWSQRIPEATGIVVFWEVAPGV
jgi:hypothetical protein